MNELAQFQRIPAWCWGLILGLMMSLTTHSTIASEAEAATAIFAGGCFWCVEADFDKVSGVISTTSGYIGGTMPSPTYQFVSAGGSGYYEAVEVHYNPGQVSYAQLVDYFWHHIDPTDADGQFCDQGDSYRSAIFYLNDHQKSIAEASKTALLDSQQFLLIATAILPATQFHPAEAWHQNYYQDNPWRYRYYRFRCGRDQKIAQLWGSS